MIVGTSGWNNEQGLVKGWLMGISLAPNGTRGQKLWETEFTPPFAALALNISRPAAFTGGLSMTGVYPEDGVFTWADPQTLQRWVYDLYTGQLLWTSPPENQFEYYGISQVVYNHQLIGYGNYGGQIISYDIKTGEQKWNYTAKNQAFESPYGNYPMTIGAVSEGKIYTVTSEHHNIQPMYRGQNLRCINATTGEEIWKILCFGSGISIADGILIKGNNLDNMIYAFGRGPSSTTVGTSGVSVLGNKVMITGTVTDQTPTGRLNTNENLDFSLKGTPAISDADMSAWMEYKFMQQAKPTNIKGVPVSLDTIDPNGNFVHIGDVTSDMNGNYAIPYIPNVPGAYQVIATFDGSRAYGPSSATTYIYVDEVLTQPTTTPVAQTESLADTYFLPTTAALFVLFIIVIALLVLIMRKKP
jgi:outer membrane protein assembly factor BamB